MSRRARSGSAAHAAVVMLVVAAALIAAVLAPPARVASAAKSSKPAKSSKSKTSTKSVPESLQVLVTIGDQTITRRDVQHRLDELPEQYKANYSTPEGKQQLLDRMVEERVWMMEASRAGVPARPAVERQLEQQRRDLLIRTYLNEVMANSPSPSTRSRPPSRCVTCR